MPGAHAPSPPPPVGSQSCLHWGQEPERIGGATRCAHHSALASICPRWTQHLWELRIPEEFGPEKGSIHTALVLLGFSLRSEVDVGFSRRVTGMREVDFQLLINGDKANGAPSPPSAHTALTAPLPGRGRRGPGLWICLEMSIRTQHRFWGTAIHSQILLLAKAPKPEPPLPGFQREQGWLYRVTAEDPRALQSGSHAPPCSPASCVFCSHWGSSLRQGVPLWKAV